MTDTITTKVQPRECFGAVVLSQGVNELVPTALIQRLLDRHFNNDWGDLDEHDAQMNAEAVNACDGQRVHSSYSWPKKLGLKENIWIMTYLHSDPELQKDPNHCYTTVLFPSEY